MRLAPWVPLALLAACSKTPREGPAIPVWAVSESPFITVGAAETEPGHELATVSGGRMQRGAIIIANTGSHELQRFDSTGKPMGFEGRKGQGPGEFLGIIRLSAAPADSLYVFDDQNLRWSVHDGQGHYARTLSGGAAALASPIWPYRRLMVQTPAGAPVPAWVISVLDSVPEPPQGAPAALAFLDDLGALWIHDAAATRTWVVYTRPGAPAGRVTLPPSFILLQAGRDFVLGIQHDSSDLELVRAYRLERPSVSASSPATPSATLTMSDSATRSRMFADFHGLLIAQELFYSNHASYTANVDSLGAKLESAAELVLLGGDKRHWAGLLYDRTTRTSCAISVGFTPNGWLDGTPFCGR